MRVGDRDTHLPIWLYVPSDRRGKDGVIEGIHEFRIENSALDSSGGLPSWCASNDLLPHTHGADANLPMAVVQSCSLPYDGNELRIFFGPERAKNSTGVVG